MIEIRLSSNLQPGESPGPPTASSRLPALLRNEIVQGKVIRLLAGQDAMIAIKHRNVIARSQVPLGQGEVLLLKVEQTSPTPLLRLLGSVGRFPGAGSLMQAVEQNPWRQVLESLGEPAVFSQEQSLLRDLLKGLSTLAPNPQAGQFLREWIEKSGLSLESRLRTLCQQGRQTQEEVERVVAGDLKGLLARMINKEDGASLLAKKLFDLTETLQWFNHGSLEQAGKLFFLLPCEVPDGSWNVAQLLIHREEESPSRGAKKAGVCRVVLVSELSNLGWVRAEVAVEGKEARLELLAGSAQSARLLQDHMPLLIANLQSQGVRVSEARCDTLDPDLLKCSIVQELTGAGAHSFSIFA